MIIYLIHSFLLDNYRTQFFTWDINILLMKVSKPLREQMNIDGAL
jgi:hypothetical protein